jgi:hypothetical protein
VAEKLGVVEARAGVPGDLEVVMDQGKAAEPTAAMAGAVEG